MNHSSDLVESARDTNDRTEATTRKVIALMGVLNTPLMPLLPLARVVAGINPNVVGAWIGELPFRLRNGVVWLTRDSVRDESTGGCIDSTGQVTNTFFAHAGIILLFPASDVRTDVTRLLRVHLLEAPRCWRRPQSSRWHRMSL